MIFKIIVESVTAVAFLIIFVVLVKEMKSNRNENYKSIRKELYGQVSYLFFILCFLLVMSIMYYNYPDFSQIIGEI